MNRLVSRWVFLTVALTGGGLDLLTKALAFHFLQADAHGEVISRSASRTVIPGFFSLEATVNKGSLWGLFKDHPTPLLVITAAIFILLVVIAMSEKGRGISMQVALGLFSAGAIGNLADRLVYRKVRDFVLFYVGDWRWPNFNLADACICVGAVLFLWVEWRGGREQVAPAGVGAGPTVPEPAGPAGPAEMSGPTGPIGPTGPTGGGGE